MKSTQEQLERRLEKRSLLVRNGAVLLRTYSNVDIRTGEPLPVNEHGHVVRKQQAVKICRLDDGLHYGVKANAVIQLANAKSEQIVKWEADAAAGISVEVLRYNAAKSAAAVSAAALAAGIPVESPVDITVTEFYTTKFLPWLESLVATGQKSHATLVTYKRYWDTYLAEHFNGTKTFRNYQPYVGQQFLDSLRKDDYTPLGANTLRHIHSAASGIFSRAIRSMKDVTNDKDVAALNPWHAIKVGDAPSISAEQGPAATEKEIEIIISNLETERGGRDDWSVQLAQTALAVGIFAGLRPSELAGLTWDSIDIDNATMTIRRAHVYGKTKQTTKTGKNRTVHYDDKLTGILRAWKAVNGSPSTGWVFPNKDGNPVNMSSLIDRIIAPNCKKNGVEWNDFYSLRRGAITDRVNLRKWSLEEAAEFAGNTAAVIEKHYLIKDGTLNSDARDRDRENNRKKSAALEIEADTKMRLDFKNRLALAKGEGQ
jgi:integrase